MLENYGTASASSTISGMRAPATQLCLRSKVADGFIRNVSPVNSSLWFRTSQSVVVFRNKLDVVCANDNFLTLDDTSGQSYVRKRVKFANFSSDRIRIFSVMPKQRFSLQRSSALDAENAAIDTSYNTSKEKRRRRVMIVYQRDENRKFVHLFERMREIGSRTSLQDWDIIVVHHSENMNLCTLRGLLKTADVFLTTHGFQCTGWLGMMLIYCSAATVTFLLINC